MKQLKIYTLVLFLALSVLLGPALAQQKPAHITASGIAAAVASRGVDTISAAQLRTYLSFIASDEMEGRDTPSRGLDTVAKFIALNLGRWGFKPYGDDGTFFQKIALRRDALDATKSIAEINGEKFRVGDDFVPNPVSATVSGPLVYAGNGWVIKSKNLDPYPGVDVKDKIIVVSGQPFPGFPRGVTRQDLSGKRGEDWNSPAGYAQQHGAKAVLIIPDPQKAQNWEPQRQRALSPGGAVVEKFSTQPNGPPVPSILMSMRMANALLA